MKKQLFKYCSLSILSMLGTSIYILADTYFISMGIGATGLAALNLAIPMYSFIHGIGLMLGVGGGIRFSVTHDERIFSQCVKSGAIISLILMLLGVFSTDALTLMLGADTLTFAYTKVYIQTLLLFSPIFILNDIIMSFLRNDDAPSIATKSMLWASGFNIVMDYILIFVFNLSMFGAVLATSLAPLIGLMRSRPYFKTKTHHFHWQMKTPLTTQVMHVFSLGIPAFISEFSNGIVIVFFNLVILSISDMTAVAAFGVIANLALVMTSIFNGLAMGMQPLVSEAFGKGQTQDQRTLLKICIKVAFGIGILIILITHVFDGTLASIFNHEKNPQMQILAQEGLRLYFLAAPWVGINMVITAYLSAIIQPLISQILAFLRGGLLLLPTLWVCSKWLGMTGVWLTLLICESIVLCLGVIYLFKIQKEKNSMA